MPPPVGALLWIGCILQLLTTPLRMRMTGVSPSVGRF